MTELEKKYLGVLGRRIEHLRQRVAKAEKVRELSYDQAELAALLWAVNRIGQQESYHCVNHRIRRAGGEG